METGLSPFSETVWQVVAEANDRTLRPWPMEGRRAAVAWLGPC